jgi:beta-aspartyl-peptidase (threonine type)
MLSRPSLAAFALTLLCVVTAQGDWPHYTPPGPCLPPPDCRPVEVLVPSRADRDREVTAAVRRVLDEQVAAWNKGDLDAFMKGYWSSPRLSFFSGNNQMRGWQATLDRYRKRYQAEGKEMGRLRFEGVEIEVLGPDAALVRGRFRLVMKKEKPTGLFTLLFRRLPEGWRIVHDHTSS